MVLYSKFAYGSQFSGEKNDLKIRYLVAKILSKSPVLFFLGNPVCQERHINSNMSRGTCQEWCQDWHVSNDKWKVTFQELPAKSDMNRLYIWLAKPFATYNFLNKINPLNVNNENIDDIDCPLSEKTTCEHSVNLKIF